MQKPHRLGAIWGHAWGVFKVTGQDLTASFMAPDQLCSAQNLKPQDQFSRRGFALVRDRRKLLKMLRTVTAEIHTHCPTDQFIFRKLLILIWRRGGDSNPRYSFRPYDGLANRCFRPLSHLSGDEIGLQEDGTIRVRDIIVDDLGGRQARSPVVLEFAGQPVAAQSDDRIGTAHCPEQCRTA